MVEHNIALFVLIFSFYIEMFFEVHQFIDYYTRGHRGFHPHYFLFLTFFTLSLSIIFLIETLIITSFKVKYQ